MAQDKKKSIRQLSESYINQINVLKAMCTGGRGGETSGAQDPTAGVPCARTLDVEQVAELSGLGDEKEALRFLYILEGHKLVSPFPKGDFTSKTWQVTDEGLKVWASISAELDVAA
jgi:hypothetical protein